MRDSGRKIPFLIVIAVVIIIITAVILAKLLMTNVPDADHGNVLQPNVSSDLEKPLQPGSNFTIIDMPPASTSLDFQMSSEVMSALGADIIDQDSNSSVASVLSAYNVKYIVLYNKSYTPLFERYLESTADIDSSVSVIRINMSKAGMESGASFLALGEGWYSLEYETAPFRWSGNQSSIFYYTTHNESEKVLRLDAKSISKNSTLEVALNNQTLDQFSLGDDYSAYYLLFSPSVGRNVITFNGMDGCMQERNSNRCLSFASNNIQAMDISEIPEPGIITIHGFYDPVSGLAWMGNDSFLQIFMKEDKTLLVSFHAISYAKTRQITGFVNGRNVANQSVPVQGSFVSFSVPASKGNNEIVLLADGCDIPASIEKSNDMRCLSFSVDNITITPMS